MTYNRPVNAPSHNPVLKAFPGLLLVLMAGGFVWGCSSKTIIDQEVSPDVPTVTTCTQDDQCAHLTTSCAKGVCTVETGQCTVALRPLGSACDVALACALGRCISGVCSPEIVLNCDDANPCTNDVCDLVKGCVHTPKASACDDGNPCTKDDVCAAGVCISGTYICDECTDDDACDQYNDQDACNGVLVCNLDKKECHTDANTVSVCLSNNPCMSSVCNAETGLCDAHPRPNGSLCSDSDLCSLEDRCHDGQCVGAPLECPQPNNPCVAAVCAPKSACTYPPRHGQPCTDGNQCTVDDMCQQDLCGGKTVDTCVCNQDSDCALYDDANLCNGIVRCMDSQCLIDPETIPHCTLPGVPCISAHCVPETGACSTEFMDGPCADGDLCTLDDTCDAGTCIGVAMVCDDGNECTADTCHPVLGCQSEAIPGCVSGPCVDGTSETCNGCGTRTCVGDAWGPCEGGIACDGKQCGDDGCGGSCGTCLDGNVCLDHQCAEEKDCQGVCAQGQTESQGCSNCGTQTRSCNDQCSWSEWGSCEGQGACNSGDTESTACGNCGSSTRTCTDQCNWGGWSNCGGEGGCSPGANESSGCGNCGSSTRTCTDQCSWGGWSNCGGEGPCSPGQSQGCGQCGSQSCNSDCQWGGCNDGGCYPGTKPIYRHYWHQNTGGTLVNADHMISTSKNSPAGYVFEGQVFQLFVSNDGPNLIPLYQAYNAAKVNHLPATNPAGGADLGYTGHAVIGYCSSQQTGDTPTQLVRVYANELIDHFATTNPAGEIAIGVGYYKQGGNLCWVP